MKNQDEEQSQETHTLLAAYALGALDAAEVAQVEAYLATTPESHAELQELREAVALLPYAAEPIEPPSRVRRQLFARIAASHAEEEATPSDPPSPVRVARSARTMQMGRFASPLAVALLVLLFFGMGTLLFMQQSRIAALTQSNQQLATSMIQVQQSLAETQATQQALAVDLTSARNNLDDLVAQFSREQQVFTFVTAPGVATRQLQPVTVTTDANGAMYMRPGQREAVVLFRGLEPLDAGKVYQFWLADGETQIAVGTVLVGSDGLGRLWLEAPEAVNHFNEVMLTVEPASGSPQEPSGAVVLEGSL